MIDGERLWKRLFELAEVGKKEPGVVTRLSYTEEERAAKVCAASYMEEAGLEVHEDAVGSLPNMGGEDFSALQQKAPGTFFWVGAGNEEKGITYPHHHPRFTIDEDALPYGVKMFLNATFRLMNGETKRLEDR